MHGDAYEHRGHWLLEWPAFLRRALRHLLSALLVLGCALGLGTMGYHLVARLNWIDAFLNASMILSGMGPVDRMETTAAKLFAAVYALSAACSSWVSPESCWRRGSTGSSNGSIWKSERSESAMKMQRLASRPVVKLGRSEQGGGLGLLGVADSTAILLKAEGASTLLQLTDEDGRRQVVKP